MYPYQTAHLDIELVKISDQLAFPRLGPASCSWLRLEPNAMWHEILSVWTGSFLFLGMESIRMNLQRIAGICQEGFFPRQSNFYVMVPFLFAKGWVRIFDVCAWSCLNNFSGQKKLI